MGVGRGDRVVRGPAQPAADRDRLPRLRQPGRGLVGVLGRHGPAGDPRPLPPDRAQGRDRRRRLSSTAASPPTACRCCAGCSRSCRACATRCCCATSTPRPTPASLAGPSRAAHDFDALVADDPPFEPAWLPFDHPLWIVYSSGTTGLPKAIVHGHGGVMLEGLKIGLHNNLGPSVADRRPLPLVRVDRLDHVELPDPRPARRHHDLPVRRQPGRPVPAPPTGRRCGASPPRPASPSSAPAPPSTPAASRPASSRCAHGDLSRAARASARPARRWRSSAIAGSGTTCRRSTARTSG